ncbi:MAG: hypothetical protein PHH82_01040 [Candidatus ainarchaeum sp.]|nr:hypothetical protein [Candidatus ainarchaeum sp.]
MKIRTGWRKKYGQERKQQIKDYRTERKRALDIIKKHGSVTATELVQEHGFSYGKAGKILLDLEREGLHVPVGKRAAIVGQREENITRRHDLKERLDAGAQISDVLSLPQYSGETGKMLLDADLEAVRKYWDAEYSLHKQDPVNPKIAEVARLVKEDPRLSNEDLAELLGMSITSIVNYLSEVPQHIKDLRPFPGSSFSIGELKKQNALILSEYLKGTKLDDIARKLNAELEKSGFKFRFDRVSVIMRVRARSTERQQLPNRPRGPTQHSLAEIERQNKIIRELAQKGLKPAQISNALGRTVTPDQVDARLRYWKKRAEQGKAVSR